LFTSVAVLVLQVTSVRLASGLDQNLVSGNPTASSAMSQMADALSRIGGLGAHRLHTAADYLLSGVVYQQGLILGFDQVYRYVTLALTCCLVPIFLVGVQYHRARRAASKSHG
jgi:hypothetical protein